MTLEDIIATLNESVLMQECASLEYETYTMNVSYRIMQHILDCEDQGIEPNIMEVGLPEYPMCTGPITSRVGDCFGV